MRVYVPLLEFNLFSLEASKKAWLVVVVGALGKTLNERPSLKVDDIFVSDVNQMRNRTAYVLPARLVKSLQQRAFSGEMRLEQMYAETQKNIVRKVIPKSK